MKYKAILLFVTVQALAASNPELEAINKKYESTLFNLQVGMSALTTQKSLSSDFDIKTKTIVLKVVGDLAYKYESSTDEEGIVTSKVLLVNFKEMADITASQIKVENDILSFNFIQEQITPVGPSKLNGSYVKNMLKPELCDSAMKGDLSIDLGNGEVFNAIIDVHSECTEIVSKEELKQLDLLKIDFCDDTDTVDECVESDMSFLLLDL